MNDRPSTTIAYLKLARPWQWGKSAFVLLGPFYGYAMLIQQGRSGRDIVLGALAAAAAFALVSSGCYAANDALDHKADQLHPRKRHRPIASGAISPRGAWTYAAILIGAGALLLLAVDPGARVGVAVCLALYALNVLLYSAVFKHRVIADVMSLSLGFVLRMVGGCAAVGIAPTIWLLNVTLFLSMFLAFGKRLGERRTLGESASHAAAHRPVQALYTDALLQMMVVVTAVITLMTYALYLKDQAPVHNSPDLKGLIRWGTLLPATYGMLRCIVLLEMGTYDDPTEVAFKDRGVQAAGVAFVALTLWAMYAN